MQWNELLSEKHFYINQEESIIYENDYDTIICSTLFRRLQDKAQVFPLDDDDYVRTRLTHSLEVSAIGKKIGEYVFYKLRKQKMDRWFEEHTEKEFSDVLLCAGLVHDIGNPPFGHFGEYAIREWFIKNLKYLSLGEKKVVDILSDWQQQDLYSFEGNAQSLRLLSKTPHLGRKQGFNLSYKVLGTIIKYPISSADLKYNNPKHYKKIGYNYSECELFQDINLSMGLNGSRHPLSYLLEAADDIAYRTSDLEDAMVKKVISFSQIMGAFQEDKKEELFDNSISGCIIDTIAKLSERFIYTSSIKTRTELFGRRVIDSLLTQFMPAAIVYSTEEETTFIEKRTIDTVSEFYKVMYYSESYGKSEQEKLYLRILMITDYISGMTDNYAKKLYRELFI